MQEVQKEGMKKEGESETGAGREERRNAEEGREKEGKRRRTLLSLLLVLARLVGPLRVLLHAQLVWERSARLDLLAHLLEPADERARRQSGPGATGRAQGEEGRTERGTHA